MQPRHGFLHSNETDENITIGSKKVDWLRSFHFWTETVHHFFNGTNRCIKCNPAMVFCTVTKLTKTSLLGPKKWIGCIRFVSGLKLCIVSLTTQMGALNATFTWFFAQ